MGVLTMALKMNLPMQTGDVLTEQMQKHKMSISDLAEKLGTSYEHVRSMSKGNTLPSKLMVQALAEALKMKREDLDRIVTADRIRIKFGTISSELFGKNPELEPLERIWNHLSQDHKADLIAQAQAWAKRDRETIKKH
jgi:plasmid maintenance system antidote protein VapI